jgi:hypothetical protein
MLCKLIFNAVLESFQLLVPPDCGLAASLQVLQCLKYGGLPIHGALTVDLLAEIHLEHLSLILSQLSLDSGTPNLPTVQSLYQLAQGRAHDTSNELAEPEPLLVSCHVHGLLHEVQAAELQVG